MCRNGAKPYAAYAYENWLAKGASATQFGMGDAYGAMYLTFVLRSLRYSDDGGMDRSTDEQMHLILTDKNGNTVTDVKASKVKVIGAKSVDTSALSGG